MPLAISLGSLFFQFVSQFSSILNELYVSVTKFVVVCVLDLECYLVVDDGYLGGFIIIC